MGVTHCDAKRFFKGVSDIVNAFCNKLLLIFDLSSDVVNVAMVAGQPLQRAPAFASTPVLPVSISFKCLP